MPVDPVERAFLAELLIEVRQGQSTGLTQDAQNLLDQGAEVPPLERAQRFDPARYQEFNQRVSSGFSRSERGECAFNSRSTVKSRKTWD